MLETLAKVFFEFAKVTFFRESFAKVGSDNQYVKGCHPLPPGVRQEKGTGEFRFGSGLISCVDLCGDAFGQSIISSSRASKGEALGQPNTMVLKHILAPAAVTA